MANRAKASMLKPVHVHDNVLAVLSQVDRPGEFCTSGDRPLVMPGLKIDGIGVVSLPLTKTSARQVIKLCRKAPYGKGIETVVDTKVRRVWELDPAQFQLTNPKWDELVTSMVNDVKESLGLGGRTLVAHLYKLLVYEEGSFFLPHRDGEKLDRMVATLVIGLPAVHEGGELIVSHDGRSHKVVFDGAAAGYELSYAAFYADCQHEVKPVRRGYRLCLTYNLTLAKSRGKQGVLAPSYASTATTLGELLRHWSKHTDQLRLAVTLEHRYTQKGLAIDNLKGVDRARAGVLFEAAEQADCDAHLALVTLWQSGAAEGGYDDDSYGYGRRRGDGFDRGYHWSDDENDSDYDNTTSTYEMGEVFDSSLTANHWSDRDGHPVRFGEMTLTNDEIVSDEPLEDSRPNREEFEGFTGNAGMTLERWYHRAAVVIWPRARHFQVLCSAGTDAAIGGFAAMVQRLKRASKANGDELRKECCLFAAAIIDSWQQAHYRYGWDKRETDRDAFPASLCELDDPGLVERFLSKAMPADGSVQVDKSLGKFCKKHGWQRFEMPLKTVIDASTAKTIGRNAEMLRILCTLRDRDSGRIKVCTRLCGRMAKVVVALDDATGELAWETRKVDRAGLLHSLVLAMLAIGAEQPLGRLIKHSWSCDKFDVIDAHVATMIALEKKLGNLATPSPAISKWVGACRAELEKRVAVAPQEPSDYRRAAQLSCKCKDCKALAEFLADPEKRQARFAMAKARRQHLHHVINSDHCDCTHVTERRGNPQTLVCTKTTASYEAACKRYDRDSKHLARIVAIGERQMRKH
jgi:predicted 2-oxoglutarate/Fe(II)-dependent dioxygenase YbiX